MRGAAGQPRSVWKRAGAQKRAGTRKRLEEPKSSLKGGEGLGRARRGPEERGRAWTVLEGPRSAWTGAEGSELAGRKRQPATRESGRPGRARPGGQVGLVWARSGRDRPGLGQWFTLVLMFYQWFTSGLPVVYSSGLLACSSCLAGRSNYFLKEQFDLQIWCSRKKKSGRTPNTMSTRVNHWSKPLVNHW